MSRAMALVEACRKTAIPRLLAMLCVLSVFVPSFFMAGVARQLFVPLSIAVVFAMISSYVLSTTLVPVLATWMMREAKEGGKTPRLSTRIVCMHTPCMHAPEKSLTHYKKGAPLR
jgi:multidrug efflux pump subunit AcrB